MSTEISSSSSSSSTATTPTKGRALLNKILPDLSTLSTFRDNYAYLSRCSAVGMFFGMLLGVGTPVSPIFYKTFQKDAGAQFNIIFTFTCVGFLSSSIPYGLFLDNTPQRQKIYNQYLKSNEYQKLVVMASQTEKENKEEVGHIKQTNTKNEEQEKKRNFEDLDNFVFNQKTISKVSRTWAPQFTSIYDPIILGLCCWAGGHLYYPGRFVLQFEEKGMRMREFFRLTAKTTLALHRVHIPFLVGWSLFFGVMVKPLRKSHEPEYYYSDKMKDLVWGSAEEGKEKSSVVVSM